MRRTPPATTPGVARSSVFDRFFWCKVRLTISIKTGQVKVRYCVRYLFYRYLSSSMTQHLTTFNTILFTKGGFSATNCTKIVFVSAGALPRTARGRFTRPTSRQGSAISPPRPLSSSTHWASWCPVRFFKRDHLASDTGNFNYATPPRVAR